MQMVRSCDASQRKFAVFLIIVIIIEVFLICTIIEHEHHSAEAEQRHLIRRKLPNDRLKNSSFARLDPGNFINGNRSLISVGKHVWVQTLALVYLLSLQRRPLIKFILQTILPNKCTPAFWVCFFLFKKTVIIKYHSGVW